MNALPLKSSSSPGAVIDELIANHGFNRVFLAVAARLFRKQYPPDPVTTDQALRIDGLSAHLRNDVGLLPEHGHRIHIDPLTTQDEWVLTLGRVAHQRSACGENSRPTVDPPLSRGHRLIMDKFPLICAVPLASPDIMWARPVLLMNGQEKVARQVQNAVACMKGLACRD
ncbi:hypothetical protein [Yoonia sediminilitoris]|uniref:Uncharacterized protein n=1 Tax=Yoonia sediminilitoris TaxID=1286148 RepID=A0A2T6KFZ4_9RHOB|nr:hypothetical protein [Yoonia sediminilitoris]PUB14231.1 hypothetical protein C8N45_106105 [Yoonia sediminilitoris]RCW95162.1 hypothetical protein DFP92_106105 [Yoonia sediminilitoris]